MTFSKLRAVDLSPLQNQNYDLPITGKWINLGFGSTDYLPLPRVNISTYFSLGAKL